MMNPLRLSPVMISIVPAPVLRSVALATGIVGLLATSGSEGLQTTGAAPPTDISAPSTSTTQGLAANKQELAETLQPSSPQPGSISDDDLSQTQPDQTQLDRNQVAMTEPSLAGDIAGASIATKMPEPPAVETAPTNASQASPPEQAPPAEHAPSTEHVPPNEPAPMQIATVNPSDVDLSDIEPRNAGKAATSIDSVDECLGVDICIDRYLWALYQRAPKEDTLKMVEWRNVTVERKVKVKVKGKGKEKSKTKTVTVTVSKAFTKLVEQDFGWKDPKAAERARLSMMDYVIGGMDRGFKLKLFHMLRAAEAAGLSPGITSGFRDDYRQSIASGLRAASNRSYHGGSLRGGYGHGVAADVVSVEGDTRDQRFASSVKLWKWVDAHGKEFGIARPYLARDPPHVAPIDGEEYAKHFRGTKLAAANVKKADAKKADVKKVDAKKVEAKKVDAKKVNRVSTRDPRVSKRVVTRDASRPAKPVVTRDASRPAKRPTTAAASKLRPS
ncbi:hypothetical protein V1291_004884 [Nitrobacteraceae bacterium AZCC 1564]